MKKKTCSARKVLENRSLADEERMDALENQLKEARFLAEEADKKYDEVLKQIHNTWQYAIMQTLWFMPLLFVTHANCWQTSTHTLGYDKKTKQKHRLLNVRRYECIELTLLEK